MALKFYLTILSCLLSFRLAAEVPPVIDDSAHFFSREAQIVARELLTDLSSQMGRPIFVKTAQEFSTGLTMELAPYPPKAVLLLVSASPSFVTVVDKTDSLIPAQRTKLIRPFLESFPYLQRDRALMGFVRNLQDEAGGGRSFSFAGYQRGALYVCALALLGLIFFAAQWRVRLRKYLVVAAFGFCSWLVANSTVYFSLGNVLLRDNMSHLNIFSYMVDYWRKFGTPPSWTLTKQGGVWLEVLSNNHLLIAPYKLPFYFISVYGGMPTNLAYKLSILTGICVLLLGIYFLFRRLCKNPYLPVLGTTAALFSAIGTGVLHQEQTLGTMFFIPWIWLALLYRFRGALVVAAFFIGFALNLHYPQLHIGYLMTLAIGCLLSPQLAAMALRTASHLVPNRKKAIFAVFILALGASPILFSYSTYFSKLSSPFRGQTDTITERTFEEYSHMRGIQQSSLPPRALMNYILPSDSHVASMGWFDDKNVFVVGALGVFLLLAFFLRLPYLPFHFFLMGGLLFLSTGVYTFAARFGWYLLPGASLFRQWYHFTSIANLHILLFVVLTIDLALTRSGELFRTRSFHLASRVAILSLFLIPNFFWAVKTMAEYRDAATGSRTYAPLDWTGTEFLNEMVHLGKLPFSGAFVAVEAIKPQYISDLYRPGMLSWKVGHEFIPVSSEAVRVSQEGRGISLEPVHIPSGAEALVVMQADDAKWKITNELRETIAVKGKGLLELPLSAGKRFVFFHSMSFWYVLVAMLSLVTLVLGAGTLMLPRIFRESH